MDHLLNTGTFCYIDPEYQQTGMLGVKSDLYSFGVVLLQILTAMPAMGLSHRVEKALERKRLIKVLDPKVSDWPEEETQVLAQLALQCCELRKRDRPDLATVLLPALSKLREIATEEQLGSPFPNIFFLSGWFLRTCNYRTILWFMNLFFSIILFAM